MALINMVIRGLD